jgi:phage gpG-like protein
VDNLLAGAALFVAMERGLHARGARIVAKACEMVADEAKRDLGTYGPNWPPLAEATIARKQTGDSPLLETGELRDSIQWSSSGLEGAVGTDNKKGAWMELGTSRVPPRPWLMRAVVAQEPAIREMAAKEFGDLVHVHFRR